MYSDETINNICELQDKTLRRIKAMGKKFNRAAHIKMAHEIAKEFTYWQLKSVIRGATRIRCRGLRVIITAEMINRNKLNKK